MEYLNQGVDLLFKAGILGFGWRTIRGLIGLTKRLDCMRESLTSCQHEIFKVRDSSSIANKQIVATAHDLQLKIDKLRENYKAHVDDLQDWLKSEVKATEQYHTEVVNRQFLYAESQKALLDRVTDLRDKLEGVGSMAAAVLSTRDDTKKCYALCKNFEERQVELQCHIEGQMDLWSEKLLGKIIRNRRKPGPKKKRVTKKEEVTL